MNLDSQEEITQLDKSNVLGSVQNFSNQVIHAFEEASRVTVPEDYKNISNVVMCGMGGSGLAGRVIESLYPNLFLPLVRINDYNLPGFVNEKSLVICSSYSGNTEETLENANQAIAKNAKWMAIAAGGKLLDLAREHNVPYYQILPTHNPSNQPRMAIGYSVVGQLVLASKTGILHIDRSDIDQIVEAMKMIDENEAKQIAQKLFDRVILFISSEHLVGATHVSNNQLNENAKNMSFDFQIPELNHHLMEGLRNPSDNKEDLAVLLINSSLYGERIKKRFAITKEVFEKNGIPTQEFNLKSTSKLAQVFEFIQFGAYLAFYVSVLNGLDSAPIPWVDYFKEQLAK
ncbi:MAG: SIS domain-containing protein [Patescibacteria group bacterium]